MSLRAENIDLWSSDQNREVQITIEIKVQGDRCTNQQPPFFSPKGLKKHMLNEWKTYKTKFLPSSVLDWCSHILCFYLFII